MLCAPKQRQLTALLCAALVALAVGFILSGSPAVAASSSLFGNDVPAVTSDSDTSAVELGVQLRPDVSGRITGIRYYKGPKNTGTHTGSLWSGSTLLASVTFKNEGATGWQQMLFPSPVDVVAGQVYTASYFAPMGGYAVNNPYVFPKASDKLTALRGTYRYGGGYPTQVYQSSNYWVDVVFTAVSTPTPPATNNPTSTTISRSTSSTPTGEPPSVLTASLFGNDVPAVTSDSDTSAVELGVQLRPDVSGRITGIRYYKGPKNTGTHTGSLWSGSTLLASVTFKNEGATGWQQMLFPSPVDVVAGQVYTASYFAPMGGYAVNNPYVFPKASDKLTALRGTYRYGGGYPTQVYQSSNYWVDVVFTAVSTPTPPATNNPTSTMTFPTATSATLSQVPTSPTPVRTTSTVVSPPSLTLPVDVWDGGSSYWRQFPKAAAAGWADPAFFPIAVFFGKPAHAAQLVDLGVNTMMGAEHDGSSIASITSTGMYVIAQGEWTRAEVGDNPRVVGWHVSDECDMGYSGCTPDWARDNGEYGRLQVQQQYAQQFRSYNDGRFLQANFGNGVLRSFWAPNTMDDHISLMDVSSVDKYAYTSPPVQDLLRSSPDWPAGANPKSAASYGWLEDQMERFQDPAKIRPNWVFVETAKPFLTESNASSISPDQIEGAVWSAIIHGARGIAYFQHNNNGQCGTYSLVECSQALKDRVTMVNAQVKALAPVLNSPTYKWDFGSGTSTMLKTSNGAAYIFAGIGLNQGVGLKSFILPPGVSGTSVEVVGEARTIPVVGGRFGDTFSNEFSHHTYRILL